MEEERMLLKIENSMPSHSPKIHYFLQTMNIFASIGVMATSILFAEKLHLTKMGIKWPEEVTANLALSVIGLTFSLLSLFLTKKRVRNGTRKAQKTVHFVLAVGLLIAAAFVIKRVDNARVSGSCSKSFYMTIAINEGYRYLKFHVDCAALMVSIGLAILNLLSGFSA